MRTPSMAAQVVLALAVVLALGAGLTWVWAGHARAWAGHLDRAARAGVALYASLALPGLPAPEGLVLSPGAAPEGPQPARETRLSILDSAGETGGGRLALVIVSPSLTYSVAGLDQAGASPAERLGQVTRAMARHCSDAVLFARRDTGGWVRVEGPTVWTCAALPRDLRLPATLAAVLALAGVLGWLATQRAGFERVLAALGGQFGGVAARIPRAGPPELRALADAANAMQARERDRLKARAALLAGISHDLGAPTTRLRLRAALIPDDELRARFQRDIEQMADMIDGVLTHTREEMAQEAPRLVSVLSLVQSVADDFADMGAPVRLAEPEGLAAGTSASLFATGRKPGAGVLAADRRMLARCRPNALCRAVTNLVDNALKYGRRAEIALEADARELTILVRDAGGSGLRAEAMAELIAPFSRGANAATSRGAGMGLAIVDGIARQHGGTLSFTDAAGGIEARLTIRRG